MDPILTALAEAYLTAGYKVHEVIEFIAQLLGGDYDTARIIVEDVTLNLF